MSLNGMQTIPHLVIDLETRSLISFLIAKTEVRRFNQPNQEPKDMVEVTNHNKFKLDPSSHPLVKTEQSSSLNSFMKLGLKSSWWSKLMLLVVSQTLTWWTLWKIGARSSAFSINSWRLPINHIQLHHQQPKSLKKNPQLLNFKINKNREFSWLQLRKFLLLKMSSQWMI